jgi:hypothetical protein
MRFLRTAIGLLVVAHGLVHLTIWPGAAAYGGGRLGWAGRTWWTAAGEPGVLGLGRAAVVAVVLATALAGLAILVPAWRPRSGRALAGSQAASLVLLGTLWPGLTPEPSTFWRGPCLSAVLLLAAPAIGAAGLPGDRFLRSRWASSVAARWGSTPAQRARRSPAEDRLEGATTYAWRGVDVPVPAALAVHWLGQLRVAPYSYDLLDNRGRRSPRTRDLDAPPVAVGDGVMSLFTVTDVHPGVGFTAVASGPPPTALSYEVRPVDERSCRIEVAIVARSATRLSAIVLVVIDAVMMRRQLLNLARWATREARAAEAAVAAPASAG